MNELRPTLELINDLNDEFEEICSGGSVSYRPFQLLTDGNDVEVTLFGGRVWTLEDEDGRGEDESLEDFLRRRAREFTETVSDYHKASN